MADFDRLNWEDEDSYWRTNFGSRAYGSSGTYDYEYYQPGYRYGFESANRYRDRDWKDVEADLRSGWNSYQYRGNSTWENIKDAVRDAWDRVTGHRHAGVNR